MEKPSNDSNMINFPKFGVAGFPPNFFKSEYRKKRENIFEWLNSIGLEWIELQNTYGVKMKDDQAKRYRDLSNKYNIKISLHGPYYITLASDKRDVVERSKERILQCVHLAETIGSNRIIFHPGFFPGKSNDDRRKGLTQIITELNSLKNDIPKGIFIYPETAGKISQIGSFSEILEICEKVDFARPCLDIAHIHGFERGSLYSPEAIVDVFNSVEARFGREYLKDLHVHMYPIEFDKNGEKRHRAFDDQVDDEQTTLPGFHHGKYYPRAEHFSSALVECGISPIVVCEAKDTQDTGAILMKHLYYGYLKGTI